ncbi:DUF3293 domain-containing protein [Roseomonas sp. CECT 9278]|uniref:DUF3293 domain-containing protein n=1 Tax=Roseomonas sp. CECT 9278 TaxID=2845823 RepID=UPI001E4C6E3E|nr:DUF3293 domain-containing protein [Roseomonas sp. CECT 9278]CAH0239022.1 hypothetical protein ROS9278_02844 [Roseomonas sp. CECT 9278]
MPGSTPPPGPARRAHLRRAWRATLFEADGIVVPLARGARQVGAWRGRHGAARALLVLLRVAEAAFVGAWNPHSRRRPRGWNQRRLDRLRAATRRLPRREGMGRACRPRPWGEEHLLVGAPAARCVVLARRFRQDAILVIRRVGPPRLLVLR